MSSISQPGWLGPLLGGRIVAAYELDDGTVILQLANGMNLEVRDLTISWEAA